MRTGYGTLRFEDSDSWIYRLWHHLNLVSQLDSSVTLGFRTLTFWTCSLQSQAPHGNPHDASFPKQEGSWFLFLRVFHHNWPYSLLGLLLYPGTPPFSPIQPGWSFLQGKGGQSAADAGLVDPLEWGRGGGMATVH